MFRKVQGDVHMHPEKVRPKLCRDCQHFVKSDSTCRLFGTVDTVDGTIDYLPARVARDFYCKDMYHDLRIFD